MVSANQRIRHAARSDGRCRRLITTYAPKMVAAQGRLRGDENQFTIAGQLRSALRG